MKELEKNDSHLSRILQKGNDCAIHVRKHPLEEALTGSGGVGGGGGVVSSLLSVFVPLPPPIHLRLCRRENSGR